MYNQYTSLIPRQRASLCSLHYKTLYVALNMLKQFWNYTVILWLSWTSVCSSLKKWAMFWSSWETGALKWDSYSKTGNHCWSTESICDLIPHIWCCVTAFLLCTFILHNLHFTQCLTKSNIFYLLWMCMCVCVTQLLFTLSKYWASNPNICTSHFDL